VAAVAGPDAANSPVPVSNVPDTATVNVALFVNTTVPTRSKTFGSAVGEIPNAPAVVPLRRPPP